jgi:hypothetical protein
MSGRYLEDFAVGQTFGSGRLRVDKEQIKAFAAEFDPQPFQSRRRRGAGHNLRRVGGTRLTYGGSQHVAPEKATMTRGLFPYATDTAALAVFSRSATV